MMNAPPQSNETPPQQSYSPLGHTHAHTCLAAQPSPFLAHNNWEAGFVDDQDRVALNTLKCVNGPPH